MLLGVGVLVAGMGNVLRADDGFGVVAAQRLQAAPLPEGVTVVDIGIGGIHLVHELFVRTEALIVLDAMDLNRSPGTVVVMRSDVEDPKAVHPDERGDQLADMHYATPERALMLARGMDVLPSRVWIVGCQIQETDELATGLSPEVEGAVGQAVEEVKELVRSLGISWP
jgi:hydrogenase maturation protease